MKQLGQPAWFSLGDLDLATHLTRTALLRDGKTLSEATAELATKYRNWRARAADVGRSRLDHAGYGEGHADLSGILRARATSRSRCSACGLKARNRRGLRRACSRRSDSADVIRLRAQQSGDQHRPDSRGAGNSRGIADDTEAPVIGGEPHRRRCSGIGTCGAADEMMGWPSTVAGVAKAYEDFLDVLVVDNADRSREPRASNA